jgi:hypothetical protein
MQSDRRNYSEPKEIIENRENKLYFTALGG